MYHFNATYMTKGGNVGRASFYIKAETIEDAQDEGLRRVRNRKSYLGKLDASCWKMEEGVE